MKYSFIVVLVLAVIFSTICGAEETISGGAWSATCEKGEVLKLVYDNAPVVTELGDFRVAGRDVRAYREVAELRDKVEGLLVYEGICDDGFHVYVEFGQAARIVGSVFEFMVFNAWLPPSTWPADAIAGVVRFSPEVASVTKQKIPESEAALPNTLDFAVALKNGKKLKLRIMGLDAGKLYLKEEGGCLALRFEEARDYVFNPFDRRASTRTYGYWIGSTDTHYVKFTFTPEGPGGK